MLRAIRLRANEVTLVAAPRYAALAPALYDHLIDGQGPDALWLHGAGPPPQAFDAAVVVTPGVADRLRNMAIPYVREISARPPPQTHTAEHLWSAVSDWAGQTWSDELIHPDPDSLARVDARLHGMRPVVLAPDAAGDSKRWPHMEALAHALSEHSAPVIWMPGRDQPTPAPTTIASLNLDLAGIVALAHRCRCWIGNDTGTTHLASAAGADTRVFFGPTDPSIWAPPRSTIFPFNSPMEVFLEDLLMHSSAAD